MQTLNVGVFGGLGKMSAPMAAHFRGFESLRVAAVMDRGKHSPAHEEARQAWKTYGAELTSDLQRFSEPDLDGVLVCCGKNGDDLSLVADLTRPSRPKDFFICHMSTVSAAFVRAATEHCRTRGIHYVNYPLTGGVAGAVTGTLLLLCSGERQVFDRLQPALSRLGTPRYFGKDPEAGARAKFIGHLLVFNGLMGILSGAALYTAAPAAGTDIVDFFDFLNRGAGGTKQWDIVLRKGLAEEIWNSPFSVRHAAVDALYTAQLAIDSAISRSSIYAVLEMAGMLCFLASRRSPDLATHALFHEMIPGRTTELDAWMTELQRKQPSPAELLQRCIASLPESMRSTVKLEVTAQDFKLP